MNRHEHTKRNVRMKNANVNKKVRRKRKKKKKSSFKVFITFLIFEALFTACTFPFLLLYGPFDTAKSTYVGAAMTSKSHQFLATLFMSEEKINNILGNNSVDESSDETTDLNAINVPKIKDNTIELYKLDDNSKYTGYYLVIKDPTRVKIGVTSKLKVEGETTSEIAQNNDAIAAINGGGFTDTQWTGTGGLPIGVIMTDGEVKYSDLSEAGKTDLFAITKDGKMVVGKYSLNDLKKIKASEALSFKPTLIINGKNTPMKGDGGWGVAPRTAIGQRKEDGAIIMLVIDGRGIGSTGATIKEVQEIMQKLKCYNAINLDGGKSATMYYDGDLVNEPSYSMGERLIPSAVIVK